MLILMQKSFKFCTLRALLENSTTRTAIFNTSARIIIYGPLRDNNFDKNNPKIESDHLNAQFFSEICFREIS